MPSPPERVLGIPTSRLNQAGLFQGFRSPDPAFAACILDPRFFEFRPRPEAELDPTFKQLIPYAVLRHGSSVFHYRRGQGGGEARLRALRSIGVGGHISADEDAHTADPYRSGLLRELHEEVVVESAWTESMIGFINDDSLPVGRVHLGVVHVFNLESPLVRPREDGVAESGFAEIAELLNHRDAFETWSQFTLDVLAQRKSS